MVADQMPPPRWPLASMVLVLVAFVLAGSWWGSHRVEANLAEDAHEALAATGTDLTVEVSGQDVILSGTATAAEDVEQALAIVGSLAGTRNVSAAVKVAMEPAPADVVPSQLPTGSLYAWHADGVVDLVAQVANDAEAGFLADAVAAHFADAEVHSAIEVAAVTAPTPWLSSIDSVLSQLETATTWTLEVAPDSGLMVDARVPATDAESIQQALQTVAVDLGLEPGTIAVVALSAPTIQFELEGGSGVIAGRVSDTETLAMLRGPLQEVVGPNMLTIDVVIDDGVAAASWLEQWPDIVAAASSLEAMTLSLGPGLAEATALGGRGEIDGVAQVLQGLDGVDIALTRIEIAPPLPEGTINFASDSAEVSDEATRYLENIVAYLEENDGVHLRIHGHADNRGTTEYNSLLSQRRADSVRSYLEVAGIDDSRLSTAAHGETEPLESNDTSQGMAANRRVELLILEDG